jgi:hypothetical protein
MFWKEIRLFILLLFFVIILFLEYFYFEDKEKVLFEKELLFLCLFVQKSLLADADRIHNCQE